MLRRQTSLRRQRLNAERIQLQDMNLVDGQKKFCIRYGIAIIYILICNFIPQMAGESRDKECTFRQLFAVNMFGGLLLGLLFVISTGFLCLYAYQKSRVHHQEFVENMVRINKWIVIYQVFHSVVGFGLWFFLVQMMWADWSQTCTQGWNLLYFINFVLVLAYTSIFALVLAIIVLGFFCYLACLGKNPQSVLN